MAVTAAHPSGIDQLVDRLAHNQEVVGSSPTPATSDGSTGTSHSYKTGSNQHERSQPPQADLLACTRMGGTSYVQLGF